MMTLTPDENKATIKDLGLFILDKTRIGEAEKYTIIGNNLLVELFESNYAVSKAVSNIIVDEKGTTADKLKRVNFNIFKVLAVGQGVDSIFKVESLISIHDYMCATVINPEYIKYHSHGLEKSNATPKAVGPAPSKYIETKSRLMEFSFNMDKTNINRISGDGVTFLIPQTMVKVIIDEKSI